MKLDVAPIIDCLCEYVEGDLDPLGKAYLKDELLEISEYLYKDGVDCGRKYDHFIMLIKTGEELPQPFTKMIMESPLTDKKYTVQIKEITGLRWNAKGNLIVEILGRTIKS